jgi:hypothetical protein
MNFLDIIVQARTFLRDPDGLIWDSDMLGLYWHEAQTEIAQKTGLLQRARTLRYPSQASITYMHEWEYQHTMGNRISTICPFKLHHEHEDGIVIMYSWEPVYNSTSQIAIDDNYRITQWWEAAYGVISEPPRVILNEAFESIKYAAFDQHMITHKDERTLMRGDGYYKTTKGMAQYYYFPDDFRREMVLYPIPKITFDDSRIYPPSGLLDKTISLYTGYAYTHMWETVYRDVVDRILLVSGDYLLLTDGSKLYGVTHDKETKDYDFTHSYVSELIRYNYLYDWEYDTLEGNPVNAETDDYNYMYYFEYPNTEKEIPGYITGTSDEVITEIDAKLDVDGQLFLIYEYTPQPVEDYTNELSDWPEYMLKIIMAGMLERCFSADTDGFIPSLRDYWKMRKEIGIRGIKLFKTMRSRDRDYRLGLHDGDMHRKHPRLSHHYPAM